MEVICSVELNYKRDVADQENSIVFMREYIKKTSWADQWKIRGMSLNFPPRKKFRKYLANPSAVNNIFK
jgi:hypothetical protein